MNSPKCPALVLAVLVASAGLPALGQSVISAQSGLVHYVQGRVYIGDKLVKTKFGEFPQLKENQELRTEQGRAEVLLNPGVFLRLRENSSIRMLSTRLTDSRFELLSGAALVEAAELEKDNAVTVLYKDAAVTLAKNGLYRFETEPPQLKVFDGRALVEEAGQRVVVKKGKLLPFDGALVAQKFDRDRTDSFDRWSSRRAQYLAMANVYAARSVYNSGISWRRSDWYWNPYLGMFTFIPSGGILYSPYGYRYWTPSTIYVMYRPPRQAPAISNRGWYDSNRGYRVVRPTMSGHSGTMARGASAPTTSSSSSSAPIPRSSGQAGGSRR